MNPNEESESPEDEEVRLRSGAETGDTQAMDLLGELLEDRGEIIEAESWYLKAAELGNNSAMNDLGLLYQSKGDATQAEHWFIQGAQQLNVRAMTNLANFYQENNNVQEAERWFQEAASNEHPGGMNDYGLFLFKQGRFDEAKKWLKKALDLGHPKALVNLAIIHNELGEVAEAEKCFRAAAASGNPQAMNNLGILLQNRGDVAGAEQFYLQAAELNTNKAMNNLAVMLKQRGDLSGAEKWLRKSIEVEDNKFAVNLLAEVLKEIEKIQQVTLQFCTKCGAGRSGLEQKFCGICGTKFESEPVEPTEDKMSLLQRPAENPLSKNSKFDEAVRRFQAWATKYQPLCYIKFAAVTEQLPSNLAGHIWSEYSWNQFNLLESGYLQDDSVMGYVVTVKQAPGEQTTLLETWIQELCENCEGGGIEEDGSLCASCGGYLEYEFSVPYEYPQVLTSQDQIEAFTANYLPQESIEYILNSSVREPRKFSDEYWEDSDFHNIANIIWDYLFEARDLERDNLRWRGEGVNPVDTFVEKYDDLFTVIEQFIEDEIDSSELTPTFAEQVSMCWSELCSMYGYQGDKTFDGDFDEFLEFFNVLHYQDMGLSIGSELFTIYGGKEISNQ